MKSFQLFIIYYSLQHFPGGSDSKASVYNEGDLGLIPGSGRSAEEGNGYTLQYSGLENSMDGHKELDVTEQLSLSLWSWGIDRSLGWEDPLKKEMATHSSMLAWETPWTQELGKLQSTELQKSQI